MAWQRRMTAGSVFGTLRPHYRVWEIHHFGLPGSKIETAKDAKDAKGAKAGNLASVCARPAVSFFAIFAVKHRICLPIPVGA